MIPWLEDNSPAKFPKHNTALTEPDGLLAAGGDLSIERLLSAYRLGIFPWYGEDEPILWWSPRQRMVIVSEDIHISKSMKRFENKKPFILKTNTSFKAVVEACAEPRIKSPGTWITPEMKDAYYELHKNGYASSFECWKDSELVGGMYGVHIGSMFFGESMFSRAQNASKSALIYAAKQDNVEMIDCQFHTPHLESMGGKLIGRDVFLKKIEAYIKHL